MTLSPLGRSPRCRSGKILALFVLLIPVMVGMIGLVVDIGLLMGAQRLAQNAADAGALAGADALYDGKTPAVAQTTATTYVQTHNGLGGATVVANIPPAAGPNTGDGRYCEVTVSFSTQTFFIRILGLGTSSTVGSRAVAGYEALGYGEGAIVLDPAARPGLSVQGGANLIVNGAVFVNSKSAGYDQWNTWIDPWNAQQYAVTTSNNSTVRTKGLFVAGGVDVAANIRPYDPTDPQPYFFAGEQIKPDPLRLLPVPTGANGADLTLRGEVSVNSTATLQPGIYEDIRISNGANVTFQPGIYILSPKKSNQGLVCLGDCTVTGNGVMFYITGSTYMDGGAGYWDNLDDSQARLDGPLPPTNAASLPPPPSGEPNGVKFAALDLNFNSSIVNLQGILDANSPFKDVLFFHRRRNAATVQIQSNAGQGVYMGGTIYNKWGRFHLAGGGVYNAQFVVGAMDVSGQADVTIAAGGTSFQLVNRVFLTE